MGEEGRTNASSSKDLEKPQRYKHRIAEPEDMSPVSIGGIARI
jgi:hypothetical protein